jgi:hypothetical protein
LTTSSIVSRVVILHFQAVSVISRNQAPSIPSGNSSMKRSGSSIANRPLAVPKVFSSISADIPTGSPSAITASSISRDGKVFFRWRDYADGNCLKTMTLQTDEFIRRFLLHVLPDRFVRIRHFGLLANRNRKDNIAACHKMLGGKNVTKEKRRETWQEQLLRISGIDVTVCPICQKGKMCTVERLLPVRCKSPPELMR